MGHSIHSHAMKTVLISTVAAAVFLQTGMNATAQSAVPTTINYQGALVDSAGNKVPDGNTNVIFRIFDAVLGGNLIWGPKTNGVHLFGGVFNTTLGGLDLAQPTPRQFSDVLAAQALKPNAPGFLELTVGNNLVQPRQQILTAPYAFVANVANSANRAGFATNASFATTAGSATTAVSATTADSAKTAESANTANTATIANSANTANSAATANTANSATTATTAATASNAEKLNDQVILHGTVQVVGSGAGTAFNFQHGVGPFFLTWDNLNGYVIIHWVIPWKSYPTVVVTSWTSAGVITPVIVDDFDLNTTGIAFRNGASKVPPPYFSFIAIGQR